MTADVLRGFALQVLLANAYFDSDWPCCFAMHVHAQIGKRLCIEEGSLLATLTPWREFSALGRAPLKMDVTGFFHERKYKYSRVSRAPSVF